MLPGELWEELGLEQDTVAQRAGFFEAFAKLAANPPQPEPSRLAEMSRAEDPGPGLEAFGEPPGFEDEPETKDDAQRFARPRPQWERLGVQGDALRQASISRLLLDTRHGLALLADAGERYLGANQPFGLLLFAVTNPGPAAAEQAIGTLSRLYFRDEFRISASEPLNDVQQVYLALAASANPRRMPVRPELVEAFLAQPAARSAEPLGAGGESTAAWWSLAAELLRGATRQFDGRDRDGLAERLVDLSRAHGRQIALSKLDRYHWRNYGDSVDLLDLEIACAVVLANRQLALEGEPFAPTQFEHAPPLARISLQVGLEMSSREEDEPPPDPAGVPLARS